MMRNITYNPVYVKTDGNITVTLPPAEILHVGQTYHIQAGESLDVVIANLPPRSWWDRLRWRLSQWIYPH